MPVPRDPCAWFVPWFVPLVRAASGAAALAAKTSHAELPSLIREGGENAETGWPLPVHSPCPGLRPGTGGHERSRIRTTAAPQASLVFVISRVRPPREARRGEWTSRGRHFFSRLRHPERQRSVCRPSAIRVYPCLSVACLLPSLLLRALSA